MGVNFCRTEVTFVSFLVFWRNQFGIFLFLRNLRTSLEVVFPKKDSVDKLSLAKPRVTWLLTNQSLCLNLSPTNQTTTLNDRLQEILYLHSRLIGKLCQTESESKQMSGSWYSASRSNFLHTRPSSTFSLYFLFLSVIGAGSWLCQLLNVFLLNMCDEILVNQLTKPVYKQFLVYIIRTHRSPNGVWLFSFSWIRMFNILKGYLFEHKVHEVMFGRTFLYESECWNSKKVWNPIQVSGRLHFKQNAKGWQSPQCFAKRMTGKWRRRRRRGKNWWFCLQGRVLVIWRKNSSRNRSGQSVFSSNKLKQELLPEKSYLQCFPK